MKLKGLLFLMLSIGSCTLHADWVATNVYTLEGTDDPFEIAGAIETEFTALRHFLDGLNFAFPHKAVLTHLGGINYSMHWENDENCQVANPEVIEKHLLTSVHFYNYWSDKPDEITEGLIYEYLPYTPCDMKYTKGTIKRTTTFNNKVHTILIKQKDMGM